MKKYTVYLAGGMKSGWSNEVISRLQNEFTFYDPAKHGLQNSEQYTQWDIHQLHHSDIVFGFLEKENPSGVGMALEIGYARAMNKTIILVDEKTGLDDVSTNRFAIVRNSANVVFDNLQDGIDYLESFLIKR